MSGIRVSNFMGLVPRTDPRLLPDSAAQVAQNCKLHRGVLQALREPLLVFNPTKTGPLLSMYRVYDADGDEFWLSWANDVNFVRGPVADPDGTLKRGYFTSADFEPRVSTLEMASLGTDTISGANIYPAGYGDSGTDYPLAYYTLGVHEPQAAATLGAPSGGAGTDEDRAYVYTYVTAWGEESAPSPATSVGTGKPNGTWPLTGIGTAPLNTGSISGATHSAGTVTVTTTAAHWLKPGHTIGITGVTGMTDLNTNHRVVTVPSSTTFTVALTTAQAYSANGTWKRKAPYNVSGMTKRIYRSLSTSQGANAYFMVTEIAVATTTYDDSATAASIALNATLDLNATYDMPDGYMQGIVSMPNGFHVGFIGTEICFSEPYKPHAYPESYRLISDFQIVGLGVFESTAVVMTSALPYEIPAVHPESASMNRINLVYPCLSKRSIISHGYGVMYQSDKGLVLISAATKDLVTKNFYTRTEWDDLDIPSTGMVSMTYDDRYYGFWEDSDGDSHAIIYDPFEEHSVITENDQEMTAAWNDPETGKAYIMVDDDIMEWDADIANRQQYTWLSKKFTLPKPLNFGACKIKADFTMTAAESAAITAANAVITAANAALMASIQEGLDRVDPTGGAVGGQAVGEDEVGGDLLSPLIDTETQSIQFQLYARNQSTGETELKLTKEISDSLPFRLPSGYKSDEYEFQVSGNVDIFTVQIAETMKELEQV